MGMNIFRLCGDMSHLFAMLILLMKVWKTRSCSGVSAKSQALFFMVFATRYVDLFSSITSHYLFFLGLYRLLYIVNWYYRYTQEGMFDRIAVVAGCVQTVLYMDFFYLYITKVMYGKKLTIPGGSQGV